MGDVQRSGDHLAMASFTRPANTIAYAAGQVINNSTSAGVVLTIPKVGCSDGFGSILQSIMITSSANQSTKLAAELHLFDTAPAAQNDAAAWAPSNAEILRCLGYIVIPAAGWVVMNAGSGASGNCSQFITNQCITVNPLLAAQGALYGVLVARNAYTPISGEVFQIRLGMLD